MQLLERCWWIRLSWKEVPLALVKRWWMNWLLEKDKFDPVFSWAQRVKIVVGATRELNIYMIRFLISICQIKHLIWQHVCIPHVFLGTLFIMLQSKSKTQ
ncbi:hypothetical protein Patl1_21030 [Pistacia atlantica]|uniref:Uncharacterized protein n=1 Tax=Pistacia atlantica TaxID=434234 RepID=A0ACC1BLH2_9ROSI|nr:hypothetical protein Patl1_21030 [Pistacia atlantica]